MNCWRGMLLLRRAAAGFRRSSSVYFSQQLKENEGDVHERRFIALVNRRLQGLSNFMDLEVREKLDLSDLSLRFQRNESTVHLMPRLRKALEELADGRLYKGDLGFEKVYRPEDVRMELFPPYIKPTEDRKLREFAVAQGLQYLMSTSTSTSILSQLTFFLSRSTSPNFDDVGYEMYTIPKRYMISVRKPCMVVMRRVAPGVYGVDNDQRVFSNKDTILLNQGKIIENMLTLSDEDFRSWYVREAGSGVYREEEHHRFVVVNGELAVRSQIDCGHSARPDQVFEIKSRACAPIRYDLSNWTDYLDYDVRKTRGNFESFQREYADLIRGPFIKFAFQLMIGGMDGAFIAYHNTQRFFGCQYVPLAEIAGRVFGDLYNAKLTLLLASKLMVRVFKEVRTVLGEQQFFRLGFYSCNFSRNLVVFVEEGGEAEQDAGEVKNEYEYFLKHHERSRVHRFEVSLVRLVNGVFEHKYEPVRAEDGVELLLGVHYRGLTDNLDYINFLQEAYKLNGTRLEFNYNGTWIKQ